ncbi:MAG TPA: DUF2178 domain-containing protein [bacterium]|mgnify:CR=1 FL=1|nr:DUF2178 domain-containing protein [bacterium]
MTLKQYQVVKITFVVFLAVIFSQLIDGKNYLLPIGVMMAGSLIMMLLRRRVNGVVADERDYATGGKAALLAMQIYGWLAASSMFVFYGLKDTNPAFEPIGMTLAFSTCLLMLIYSAIFRYYNRVKLMDGKLIYTVAVLVFFLIMIVVAFKNF